MRIVKVRQHGDPSVLTVEEAPLPGFGARDVLIRVKVAGINFADTMQRQGTYPKLPPLPFTPGAEVAGVIEAIGADVTQVSAGTPVVVMMMNGAYAEYVAVPAEQVIPIPSDLPLDKATAFLAQGLTAYGLLQQTNFDSVLITAAAGGVGSMAVQIAKLLGKTVYAAVGSDAKLETARQLGADIAANYGQPDWLALVEQATGGKGVDLVLETVGGSIGSESVKALGQHGKIIVYGSASSEPTMIAAQQLIFKNNSVLTYTLYPDLPRFPEWLSQLTRWYEEGKLRVNTTVYPIEEVSTAHTAMETRQSTGKLVLSF